MDDKRRVCAVLGIFYAFAVFRVSADGWWGIFHILCFAALVSAVYSVKYFGMAALIKLGVGFVISMIPCLTPWIPLIVIALLIWKFQSYAAIFPCIVAGMGSYTYLSFLAIWGPHSFLGTFFLAALGGLGFAAALSELSKNKPVSVIAFVVGAAPVAFILPFATHGFDGSSLDS